MYYCDPIWRGQVEALGITKQIIDRLYRFVIRVPPNPTAEQQQRNKITTDEITNEELSQPITWKEAPWIQEWTDTPLEQEIQQNEYFIIHTLWHHFQLDYDIIFPSHVDYDIPGVR